MPSVEMTNLRRAEDLHTVAEATTREPQEALTRDRKPARDPTSSRQTHETNKTDDPRGSIEIKTVANPMHGGGGGGGGDGGGGNSEHTRSNRPTRRNRAKARNPPANMPNMPIRQLSTKAGSIVKSQQDEM